MNKWSKITIGDIGRIITGKTPSTKNKSFWDGTIPFVTPADLQTGKNIAKTERYVSTEGLNAVKGCLLPARAICVSCIGNLGYTAMTTQVCISNQQINSIIPYDDFDNDFVYYLMKYLWPEFKNLEGQSTTLSILNKTLFSKMTVWVPEKTIQQKIANVLSSLDKKIEANVQINHNLEEQAKAIFKSWFVDFEPFQDGKFIDSEQGPIPEDWEISNLDNVADYLNGLAMQKYRPDEFDSGLPVLKIKELRQGFCDNESDSCSSTIKDEYIVKDGDVIFSWSGSLLVDFWTGGECGLNQHLFKVTSQKYEKWFYFSWTHYHLAQFIAIAVDKATTMGHIKRENLQAAKVLIPPSECYNAISVQLTPIYDLIIQNRIEARRLAQLRDSLLPKLMSGEIEVSGINLEGEYANA